MITQTVVVKEGSNIGRLAVEVVEVRGLKARDVITGTADPYAVVQGEQRRSAPF